MKKTTVKKHRKALKYWRRFRRPTPKKWAKIRTTFSGISAALLAGASALNIAEIYMPENFNLVMGTAIAVTASIAAYAQAHDNIPDKKQKPKQQDL